MAASDEDKYAQYANIPIPTYDEAIRPSSSQTSRGPGEISDDAERQGLLGQGGTTYRRPTAESARSSEDSDLHLPEVGGDDDRRRVEELDYLDADAPDPTQRQPGLYHRARLRFKLSHQLSNLGATLSSFRLPSFRSAYTSVPRDTESTTETTTTTRPSLTFPTIPERYRVSAATIARLCGLLLIVIFIYILFVLDIFPTNGPYMGTRFDPELVRSYVQEHVNAARIEEYLMHITAYDHVAGTEGDLYMAEWMKERWLEEGNLDDVALLDYYVYLNYPTKDGRQVSIIHGKGEGWVATLEEDVVDPLKKQTLAWHGHSKSGEVEGHLVFANGGNREDFAWLKEQGIDLKGSIAIMRYYGTQGDRALKIKAAEEAGCVGALLYSDPTDDGSVKGKTWPEGPWRPEDSLQRGGVSLMSWVAGDPLTPGYASTKDAKTVPKEGNPGLVQIPSLPIAWRDAQVLLHNLRGNGVEVPKEWRGGDMRAIPREWFSGASPANNSNAAIVRLKNINDENDKQQIWNLHGMIRGLEQSEKKVIVGNHRDAWCFGSVDPGSGSAVMMEMVRIFGELRKLGWRPLRTIEFVSWDAEEYNLVGSTEYVEENINALRDNAVAYLNVDVGVYGPNPKFVAAGSPMMQRALLHVLDRVNAPGSDKTLRKIWDDSRAKLEPLGAGSDYVAFQDMAGTSSLDFGFEGEPHAYPYHSCYESFAWVKKFGDPAFEWHHALAQVWALLILEIADRPLLPFDLRTYASALGGDFLNNLQSYADTAAKKQGVKTPKALNLEPLRSAANELAKVAEEFHSFENLWTATVLATGIESNSFASRRLKYNNALSDFETNLLDIPRGEKDAKNKVYGIPGREQFKHVVFGPQAWSGYDASLFPAVVDAVDSGNWTEAQERVKKVVTILERATEKVRKA